MFRKLFVVLLLVAVLFTACAKKEAASEKKVFKVAMLTSGPVNDGGWNAAAYQGLMDISEKLGFETAYTENVSVADIEAGYIDYASQGYDLIIGHGFEFGDPAVRVGERYPDTKFVAIESNAHSGNVASYRMACKEAGYLMGVLAAEMSETGKLGIIGGVEQPSIVQVLEAYKLGAKAVNPDIQVYDVYIGTFTDVAKGKEAAMAMIDKGADVLSHCANQAGTGAIKAAEENGLFATGDSYDQNFLAPNTILSSTIYNVPALVLAAATHVKNGTFKGEIIELGTAEGCIDIAPYHELDTRIPEDVKAKITDLQKQIIEGTLVVPSIEEKTM
jgi:basic membrane protein A